MANSNYTGYSKTKTMRAKKSELPPVCAKKSYKENLEKCTNSSHPSKIQKQACDSTVNDLDFKSEKRKLFSCDFEGCNKKYTKLSHLKVNKTFCIKSCGCWRVQSILCLSYIKVICSICCHSNKNFIELWQFILGNNDLNMRLYMLPLQLDKSKTHKFRPTQGLIYLLTSARRII